MHHAAVTLDKSAIQMKMAVWPVILSCHHWVVLAKRFHSDNPEISWTAATKRPPNLLAKTFYSLYEAYYLTLVESAMSMCPE